MTLAMIEFSESVGFWSKFVFWFAAINVIVTLGFTVVVIIGGLFDLKYLFAALKEPRDSEQERADDGQPSSK